MFRLASFGRFFPYLRPYRLRMAAAALLVMSAAGTNLSMLWVIRRLVDTVLVQRDPAALNTAIAELGALFLVQGLLIMGHSYLTASAGQRIIADFRMHLFNHLQSLSLGFFARRRTGELMSRLMNDVGALQTTLTEIPIDLAKQVVTLVGGLTILFVLHWRLCLLILLLLPAIVLVPRFFGRPADRPLRDLRASLHSHQGSPRRPGARVRDPRHAPRRSRRTQRPAVAARAGLRCHGGRQLLLRRAHDRAVRPYLQDPAGGSGRGRRAVRLREDHTDQSRPPVLRPGDGRRHHRRP